ncbi:4Fe-4S binding protein [Desulfosporosinus shakirovi]|uniref:4Fe-4S binding protein n=1 Tax=Desulfosporosinus shakirovi TaxID=2885154 RepID=UPI001E5513B8|nr:4Fe-4S binding protein [Desulfosporosinus sp. SRJS8]MCB8814361.1 4Fe-4S binding protein [Desulfosporosinus sp. SRJS8]
MKVLRAIEMNRCIGCFSCMITCAAVNQQDHSIMKSAIRIKTSGGLTGKFVAIVCQACKDDVPCAEACPTGALVRRQAGGVLLDKEKCVGCERCVAACTVDAIYFDLDTKRPIVCKHCGVCARFCPHGCLRLLEEGQ